jgi:60 kDa SS-A/Ro ribonucleoprotein
MRTDPLASISTTSTPQTDPVPGRADQVRNNDGGYVFSKDLWTRVEDFMILGTAGGTFYLGETRHSNENTGVLFALPTQ